MDKTTKSLAKLREIAPAGTTLYTLLRHTSQSGMTRYISVFVIRDGEPVMIDYLIKGAGIASFAKREGLVVTEQPGMDMGFDLVYDVADRVYGKGDALEQRWL